MSAAARGLKDVSGELGVAVFALVQLNRNRATRVDKRPRLADLRESGDLQNTADSVVGLYRDEIDHPNSSDRGLAELSVLKKRQLGEDVGTVRRLVWVGEGYRDFSYQSRPMRGYSERSSACAAQRQKARAASKSMQQSPKCGRWHRSGLDFP